MDAVTVITLTRNRLKLLQRAIASVQSQDYLGCVTHLIVIDDCSASLEYVVKCPRSLRRNLTWHLEQRSPAEIEGEQAGIEVVYPRIARLLNIGVKLSTTRWIAFLDDDNEFESNHLTGLIECAVRSGCGAVHSFRKIYYANGLPYLEHKFPWTRNSQEAERIYEQLCVRGVWVRNAHVLRDRAGPSGLSAFRNSTIWSSYDPIFLVDTSVWLLERNLLIKYPVPEWFSEDEQKNSTAPDDKLLQLLLENGVRIASSGLPTLRYYLGGVSN